MSYGLNIGDKTPDFKYVTPWVSDLNFYESINNTTGILIFLRYIGCPICQLEMSNIRKNINLTDKKSIKVFVVLQSSPEIISSLCSSDEWPFEIICDSEEKIFKQYFVKSASIIKYLHPSGLLAGIKAIFKGYKHGKFEGNEKQLPAAFIISNKKIITYVYYGKRINDIPQLKKLVENIK